MTYQDLASFGLLILSLATIAFLAFDALQRRRDTLQERNLSDDLERELMSYGAEEGNRHINS